MKLILATKNQKKLLEMERILSPLGVRVLSESQLDTPLPEVEETGRTFLENAALKAESASRATGLAAVADDSGLCVDALDGAPGVYSARYAGGHGDDKANNQKLLQALEGLPMEKRTAKFVCAICCVWPDGRRITVEGECPGRIGFAPEGDGGFGYDPLFITDRGCFGLLSPEEKDAVSHRGRALRRFAEELKKYMQEKGNEDAEYADK